MIARQLEDARKGGWNVGTRGGKEIFPFLLARITDVVGGEPLGTCPVSMQIFFLKKKNNFKGFPLENDRRDLETDTDVATAH